MTAIPQTPLVQQEEEEELHRGQREFLALDQLPGALRPVIQAVVHRPAFITP